MAFQLAFHRQIIFNAPPPTHRIGLLARLACCIVYWQLVNRSRCEPPTEASSDRVSIPTMSRDQDERRRDEIIRKINELQTTLKVSFAAVALLLVKALQFTLHLNLVTGESEALARPVHKKY